MADTKISALTELTGNVASKDDLLAIVSGGVTKKIKFETLINQASLAKVTVNSGKPISSDEIDVQDDFISATGQIADDVIKTANIDDNQITAALLSDSSIAKFATSAPTADFIGQLWIDTDSSPANKAYIWDGSSWDAVEAGTSNILPASASNAIPTLNITATASGNTYTLAGTIPNTTGANQFLAGPTGAGGAVSARVIAGSDLPDPTTSAKGGVIINGNGLTQTSGTIKIDNAISASGSTKSLVTYDANGLVLSGSAIAAGDLPVATSSAVGGVKIGSGLSVSGAGEVTITNSVTGATKPKVTYNNDGLVTAGADLVAGDIPAHSAALLTSGTLDVARIAGKALTAVKLADSSTCIIQSIAQAGFPTAAFTGQLCFDSVAEDAYLWDGNAWQAITTLTKGSLVNGGTFNASTSKMASITTAGSAAGLVVGSNLPSPTATTDGVYVVVATAGTPSAPAPVVALNPPDYILGVTNASGSSWNEIDLSATVSGQVASNVGFTPYGQLSSTNVQDVIQEVETEKLGKAGGEVTGELLIGAAGSLVFEGSTANAYETTIAVVDPSSADRTATFPDASGTVVLAGNAQIVNADISTSADIAHSKLADVTDGQILVGNGSNVPTAVAVSGDVTLANNGAMTVVAGTTSAVGKVQLEDSATSTSTTKAATPAAVKVAKDAADAAATTANAALPKTGGTATGHINLDNDQELRLMEADSNGSAYVGIKGATDKGAEGSYTLSLPAAAPTAGQVLKANSSTPTTLEWSVDSTNVAAGSLTGTTMAANVVTSSLTTVGPIASGTWGATDIAISHGGTGASSAAAALTNLGAAALAGATYTGAVNLGVDDTGVDLKMFGDTASAYILWDASADELLTGGGATINIVKDKLKIGGTAVTTTAAELNLLDGKSAVGDASLGTAQTFTATQSGTITSISYGSSVSLNLNTTNNFAIGQLTGAFTLANPSALTAGASGMIKFQQHASSPVTPAFGTYWHFPGGSAAANFTQTAGAIDILVYTVLSSTSIACDLIKDVKD